MMQRVLCCLALTALPAASPAQAGRGVVRVERFFAPSLGTWKHYVVYLPPSYALQPARRFAVAYYLHGLYGNEGDWITLGAIDVVPFSS